MKKRFSELNYYEMLDIKPTAVLSEIRHAYNAAMQVYQPESLASYSFFPEEERHEIMSLLEKAYATLSNEKTRKEYDDHLIRRGDLSVEESVKPAEKKPVSIFDINRAPAAKETLTSREELKNKIRQSATIGALLSQSELRGSDLKKIRQELDVPVELIAKETRVRPDYLRAIEEDALARLPSLVFLKGFIKAYLKCLGLEPADDLSTRYMETIKRPGCG